SDEIIAKHRNSNYYPYALIYDHAVWNNTFEMMQNATERFHHSPIYWQLLGETEMTAERTAYAAEHDKGAFEEAERYLKLAVFYMQEAADVEGTHKEGLLRTKRDMEKHLDRVHEKRAQQQK